VVHEQLAETVVFFLRAVDPVDGVGGRQGRNLVHPANDGMLRREIPRQHVCPGSGRRHDFSSLPVGLVPTQKRPTSPFS
jgi:hypothetical protein